LTSPYGLNGYEPHS